MFFDFLIAYFTPYFIPYLGHFSHPKVLAAINLPQYIRAFANFDGIFYIRIAQNGYSQFEHAFFPLYPISIKYFAPIFGGNHVIAGLMISYVSFFVGLYLFSRYISASHFYREWMSDSAGDTANQSGTNKKSKRVGGVHSQKNDSRWSILFLLLFPTSFFFGAVYTESLFFFFTICTFYNLSKKKYMLVAIFAFLASLTRLIGVFLFIPIFLELWINKKRLLPLALTPFVGLGLYMTYLARTVGDPLAFFTAHAAFGAGRSTQFILFPQVYWRYLKILTTTPLSFSYFISFFEALVFTLFLALSLYATVQGYKKKQWAFVGLGTFSLANILIPTATGTFLSIPRFALMSLSAFVVLGQIEARWIKISIAVLFAILHVVLVSYFVQGYFVS